MSLSDSLIVSDEMIQDRLDRLLAEHYPAYSRTYFQTLIEQGFVLINSLPVKKKAKPKLGDEIEICFQLTPEISLEPENIPLDILYEDEHLLAINKPAGMVTHPAPGHYKGTFVHALLYHCKTLPMGDSLRPGIVHRLDKETSGVLLAAKTSQTHQKLVEMFCERKLDKSYLAICVGTPGNGTIEAPIKRHPTKRKEMCVNPTGKPATSITNVLAFDGKLSLVEVKLITGRTHQIRVHLKHKGAPILGDPVYGSPTWNKQYDTHRQMLHAYRLSFSHPITGERINLKAPLTKDFRKNNLMLNLD
ncbi:MAG TPA: RluA family pseudouridine synthase [Rhabdochlamydiaceae bacterium]|jgi:23S rRNA pseudouridine1911/1915/1917 synthase|nr:RluA family pseudouridine synthase [Rhabdochlamydiaceae bacterium]